MIGEQMLVVRLNEREPVAASRMARRLEVFVQKQDWPGLREVVAGIDSLSLIFDPLELAPARLRAQMAELLAGEDWRRAALPPARRWRLPVCYGGACGPDLSALCEGLEMDEAALIAAHCAAPQTVLMIGFAPGFLYTGHLPALFDAPRRTEIHAQVPAGSLSVAIRQTVISATAHSTGWHVIGRTPFRNFAPGRRPPVIIRPGDEVIFAPISGRDYRQMRRHESGGLAQVESSGSAAS